jgi:Glycosyl transferase family 2
LSVVDDWIYQNGPDPLLQDLASRRAHSGRDFVRPVRGRRDAVPLGPAHSVRVADVGEIAVIDRDPRSLVELVVPTYGRRDALVLAVRSALAETPFRVTVLDDNSPEPAAETLDVAGLNAVFDDRLRVIRNPLNLGASLNILRALEVSRAPYTWPFADDHVVPRGAGGDIVEAIAEHPKAAILFWHLGLPEGERVDLKGIAEYVQLIERGRSAFGFSDVHCNRVVRTDVGRRYQRFDARFSHAQPMLGIQLAALADGLPVHICAGTVSSAQPSSASGWSASYLERFKLDPAYLIPDATLRRRYRAVVARHFPWRAVLIDAPPEQRGSINEAFALDAAILIAHSPIPLRLRAEARLALFLRTSRAGRQLARALPKKRGERHEVEFERMTW